MTCGGTAVQETGMEYRGNSWNAETAGSSGYRKLPVCCTALIGMNVVIFLIGLAVPALGAQMEEAGCFSVLHLLYGNEFYRLVTAAFLHEDAGHLINNMLLLYFCGEVVEKSLGKCRTLILYVLSAVCGNLLSAAYELSTGSYYYSIGASGAVFGLTGALLFLVIVKKGEAAHLSIKRMVLAVVLWMYAGFCSPHVNNAAHVGGLLGGFLLAFLLSVIPSLSGRKGD